MAVGKGMSFPVEPIGPDAALFRQVPPNRMKADGRPRAGAFTEHGRGMSTDWNKYSTPLESQARSPRPVAIVRLEAARVSALGLSATHTPRNWNRAHVDVTGIGNDEEIRLALADLATVEIPLP